ncbi:unnamed protein product, partial [Meganyctiphanes norvegica]
MSCALLPAGDISVIIADHNRNSDDDDVEGITCTVKAQELILNDDYEVCGTNTHEHDIALIKLSAPLSLTTPNDPRPICLPTSSSESYVGTSVKVVGWGVTSRNSAYPDIPHELTISVVTDSKCDNKFYFWSADYMLCADDGTNKPVDACTGDAGSPLIAELTAGTYTVIGTVSGGTVQCKGPGVYTRVDKYLDWIKTTADLTNICPVL